MSERTQEDIVKTMAERMAAERASRDMTLQELADSAGLSKSQIWEIEQGRSSRPTIFAAISIARALGISVDYLTGEAIGHTGLHPEAMKIACKVDALLRAQS